MVEKVEGFYEKIVGDTGGLRNLLSKIPGLSGYMERGRRREADQLLRDTITGRLEQARLSYSSVYQPSAVISSWRWNMLSAWDAPTIC